VHFSTGGVTSWLSGAPSIVHLTNILLVLGLNFGFTPCVICATRSFVATLSFDSRSGDMETFVALRNADMGTNPRHCLLGRQMFGKTRHDKEL
jgi:hypothetical protein